MLEIFDELAGDGLRRLRDDNREKERDGKGQLACESP